MKIEEIISHLADYTTDAVIISEAEPLNQPGPRVVWCNKAFTDMTGYRSDEIIGHTPRIMHGPETDQRTRDRIRNKLKSWEPVHEEILNYKKDGTPFWVDLNIHPVADSTGWVYYWVAIQRDVTAHKRRTEILANSPTKPVFINHLAHEIRTPLNGIMGYIELLQQTELSEQQAGYLEVLNSASHLLLGLINNILDLARLESQEAVLNESNFNLHDCLHTCINIMAGWAQTKKLRLTVNIHPKTPVYVCGDSLRLRQIILNILTNALKFTPEGSVTLSVRPSATANGIHISIDDTGIGVPKERLDAIFMEFVQASSETSRSFGGSGLGLNLSRRLARVMGGDIDITSTVGIGTTVVITLPLPAVAVLDPETIDDPNVAKIRKNIGSGKSVMVVDDNPTNCELVANMLQKVGYDVDVADNGEAAINLALNGSKQYKAILMDIRMPGISGIGATKEIFARVRGRDKPNIIACTADTMPESIAACETVGMCDHLIKPFRMHDLLERLEHWA